ncbi:MAG: type II toxin-antitoxin system HicA family toxin [Candidatus Omnitrophica bacterium]|nr:type II toxin-antitoxin system HicA family toxin [Candidatus Omnitrophota bacterium]
MSEVQAIYAKAQTSPNNITFSELCALIEGVGFEFKRQKGSHRIYKHKAIHYADCLLPVQDRKGNAKPYQVRQVLKIIDSYNLL